MQITFSRGDKTVQRVLRRRCEFITPTSLHQQMCEASDKGLAWKRANMWCDENNGFQVQYPDLVKHDQWRTC